MCHPIPAAVEQQIHCGAASLDATQRQQLAIRALAGNEPISKLAQEHDVSRKFVYQQTAKAEQALELVFAPVEADDEVLFHLPVTRRWLRRLMLALTLICHSPFRGVVELLRDLFNVRTSVGTVHNVVQQAADQARAWNAQQDLSTVDIGAHDEIFHCQRPVLAGIDVHSTYCYLLSLEEQRDGDTWGVRLLELKDRGFAPKAVIADAGAGIRKGMTLAMSDVSLRGDVFHVLMEVTELVGYLENRAYEAIDACSKLERQQARHEHRQGRRDPRLAQRLVQARTVQAQAITLADAVALLSRWLHYDVFPVAGPPHAERCQLYDFSVAELRSRQHLCSRLGTLCVTLTNQRDRLLAFAVQLDRDLEALAQEFDVPLFLVRQVLQVQELDPNQPRRWKEEARLQSQLRGRFYHLSEAVADLARHTVRASSIVENFNSRLRSYFFLRRHLGPDYLNLLQFFLNHRRFLRSERPERVDKSPAQLLTGQPHPHWLDMLGFHLTQPT